MSEIDYKTLSQGSALLARVTIKDVAAKAGVSTATVSRVLNSLAGVDSSLERRVRAAMQSLNYRPNRVARSLRNGLSQFIALVVPDIRNPFFSAVANEIEGLAFERGFTVLTCNTHDDPRRESRYLDVLTREAVAGIIICTVDERQGHVEAQAALKNGIAVVAIDRRLENAAVDLVMSDNFGAARHAVSHLLTRGHRRIGLITGGNEYAPARERRLGFEQAFRDFGLDHSGLERLTDFRDTGAEQGANELLDLPDPPSAIFVASGNAAVGAMRAIARRGLKIGRDVSLLIFDDPEWAEAINPALTTVGQDTRQIGSTALDLLMERINGSNQPIQERRIATTFHDRESCLDLRPPEEADSYDRRVEVADGGAIHANQQDRTPPEAPSPAQGKLRARRPARQGR